MARLGLLETPHGVVETPALVPVATQATVKTLDMAETLEAGSQILISNTFHLHLRPGENIIKSAGSLHKFMNWPKPLMTDSGGYQVFSLGFGSDFKVGKMARGLFGQTIKSGQQSKNVKITDEGVYFNSPVNGDKLFLGPKESIKIQQKLGADIIFAFDECPPPMADHGYLRRSLKLTHEWAKISLETNMRKKVGNRPSLYGIVQGGKFKDLRIESAAFISSLPFDGFGIGGELGFDKKGMFKMIGWVSSVLPFNKPRHLLGNGHVEDLEKILKSGIDTIDCIIPTHYARHGVAFVSTGQLDLKKSLFRNDKRPIDHKCGCKYCQSGYSRSLIHHLLKAGEITPLRILTFHNLCFFNNLMRLLRDKIRSGKI